ncbi:Tim44 domain-containing protein [Pseudoalteromonas sp. McH1-7]|uniref:Tim44-like domain-containing protein n=1 Tax=Pseudoalteromonas peptidolytica F12-50-A1 TaxID=1315280 RepID=A0A8I0MYN0_9GAMM|nr:MULTISPECIES: Tim44-like domain-containing protein [Pseudoalteromonas]MBE0348487.1 hypothetical protein [Pseudoalteromonas peptidolytica F12-50-A1]MDW7551379.1 Tim44-like domain-containing protein [Pseudoalteromonas peptidolytica]NLR16731.1 Tim44 domain-containing protein [Pseudoalteromonas peptidolytica]NUZ12417.1 Tim44 domain-containing protein [Pseudoalteromonas sp. McH1-7]USD30851.1 Tim44 domain-containing protein [Pseudoalteromonas sp. SCSIO 43201]
MKHFIVLFSLVCFLFTASFDAEARKKFGSKSKGKTHQTQTTQQKQQTDTQALNAKSTAKPKSNKKGIMAGVLGGLLAGGLIAAMLGDDFEGFQFLEMILLAIAAFIIFKLVRSMLAKKQQPSFAGAPQMGHPSTPSQQPQQFQSNGATSGGFGANSVPMNLPRDFDVNGFLQGARQHYQTIQTAWNQNDFTTMAEYLSPELVEEFKREREQHGDVKTEVMFVDASLVRADTTADVWEISIKFTGKYRDLNDMQEEAILEIWHLERKTSGDAPWLIVGVEDLAE